MRMFTALWAKTSCVPFVANLGKDSLLIQEVQEGIQKLTTIMLLPTLKLHPRTFAEWFLKTQKGINISRSEPIDSICCIHWDRSQKLVTSTSVGSIGVLQLLYVCCMTWIHFNSFWSLSANHIASFSIKAMSRLSTAKDETFNMFCLKR